MIARLSASAAAVTLVAAAAIEKGKGAIMQAPTVWYFLGYPFEAASMVAALFGCLAARFWIGAGAAIRKDFRWLLDAPVSAMTLGTTATLIIAQRPSPLTGLLIGAGLGVIGEGVFKFAERMAKTSGAFGNIDDPAMRKSIRRLDKID